MYIFQNFCSSFILVMCLFAASFVVDTSNLFDCQVETVAKTFFEKFLPTLISNDTHCSPPEPLRKEAFKNCMMMLVKGDPKLCIVNYFYSYELPRCTEVMLENDIKKEFTEYINAPWKWITQRFNEVYAEQYSDEYEGANCSNLTDYVMHRLEAFGGKTKNEKLWIDYCKNNAVRCNEFKIFNSDKFLDDMFVLNKLEQGKSIFEGTAHQLAAVLFSDVKPRDIAQAKIAKLSNCLVDLFKAIEKKVTK